MGVGDGVAAAEGVGDGVAAPLGVRVAVMEADEVADGDWVADGVADGVAPPDAVPDCVCEAITDAVGDGDCDLVEVRDADCVCDAVAVAVGVRDTEGDTEGVGDGVRVELCDCVVDGYMATATGASSVYTSVWLSPSSP